MRPNELVKNRAYILKSGCIYRYGLEKYHQSYTLTENSSNYNYTRNVIFDEIIDNPVLIDGSYFNIKVIISNDIYVYTNSYYVQDNKQQTNNYTTNISEYIDEHLDAVNKDLVNRYDGYFIGIDYSSDLDVVEIRNGKANFNSNTKENLIKNCFFGARLAENTIYDCEKRVEPQADWNKEIIHMKIEKEIDDALKNGDREEFIRLSNKLKEIEL